MNTYTIYNKTDGTILKTVICPPDAITIQYDNNTEAHIEGEYNKATHKILQGRAVLKTEKEQTDYQYALVKDTIPQVNPGLTDKQLDAYLNKYFYGRKNIQQWKKDNYRFLRGRHYPPISEYNDAQVKLNSGIPELEAEGQTQLDNYIQDCLDVKTRFPKK